MIYTESIFIQDHAVLGRPIRIFVCGGEGGSLENFVKKIVSSAKYIKKKFFQDISQGKKILLRL